MATDRRTIFNYMGNKSSIADFIIQSFPTFRVYVEVFGGTMAILLNKPKSEIEIYNDFNRNLTNLHEMIRTRKDEFIQEVEKLYISEDLYDEFYKNFYVVTPGICLTIDSILLKINLKEATEEDIDKYYSLKEKYESQRMESAVRYFYIMCLCYLGKFTGGFKVIPQTSYVDTFKNKIPIIEEIHKRIKDVVILNKSYEKVITANNKEDVFLYLDPPYVSSETYYEKLAGAFSETEHIKLRDLLRDHKGTFMLSYEENDLVRDLYTDFNILSKSKHRASKGKEVEEIIVTNYQPSNTLFDLVKHKSI